MGDTRVEAVLCTKVGPQSDEHVVFTKRSQGDGHRRRRAAASFTNDATGRAYIELVFRRNRVVKGSALHGEVVVVLAIIGVVFNQLEAVRLQSFLVGVLTK